MGIYLGIELLGHMVYECSTSVGNAQQLSKVVAPIYTPNSNVYETLWIHILGAFKNIFSGFTTKEVLI